MFIKLGLSSNRAIGQASHKKKTQEEKAQENQLVNS